MAQTLTAEQAAALANELSATGRWPELESLVRAWLRTLPAEASKSRDALERQLGEKLTEALFRQGRVDESLAAFLDLARDTAPAIPAPFVDLYVEAMKCTRAMPVPLNRFHRVYALSRLVEESLALDGETAECGCFRGLSSYVICATERPGARLERANVPGAAEPDRARAVRAGDGVDLGLADPRGRG